LERFQRALKHLVHGRKGDHEHRGTNNPFVQVALLECFGMISKGDDITLECLNLILSDTDLRYTPSHAIIYECSRAILRIGAP